MVRECRNAVFPLAGANLCVRPQVGLKREGTQNRHVAEFADQLDGRFSLLLLFTSCVRVIEQNPYNRNACLPEPHEG